MNTQDIITQNAQMRALLLALSPRCQKNLGSFSASGVVASGGGSVRAKLYNVGVATKIFVEVVANVTIGTAAATLSPQAPWNIISKVRLTDYDGTDRVNIPGYGLYLINSVRSKSPYGYAGANFGAITAAPAVATPNLLEPSAAVAVGTKDIRFIIEVPLALDSEADLRGAILMQTALGEMYLNLDFNPTFFQNGNADAVFNGSATTTVVVNSISCNIMQQYLLLQQIEGQTPLPQLDLLTVYELNSLRTTDNLAVGQEKLINYPNVRSVRGVYLWYVNNNAMTTGVGDIQQFRVIANGNSVIWDTTPRLQLFQQRLFMAADMDLPPASYFFTHAGKPIETATFGNVQLGVNPSAMGGGNTHLDICFESLYTKGAVLPGLAQTT